MRFLTFIILISATSCNTRSSVDNNSNIQVLDFGKFTLQAPKQWTKIKEQGIDSYVGRIAIDSKDTLEFDLGWYSNDLKEHDIKNLDNPDTTLFINRISWDTIAGYRTKISTPKISGKGLTGIYIDSLRKQGDNVTKFNLMGENLSSKNQEDFLTAVKTLKFYN